MNKIHVEWHEIQSMVELLANKIKNDSTIKTIFAVPRGGFIPAVILSHVLNLRLVSFNDINENTVIVDDILDTGKTVKRLLEQIWGDKKPKVATIYFKDVQDIKPDFTVCCLKEEDWIVFPWETLESSKLDNI